MLNLILTLISIALTAALAVASLVYLPIWPKQAETVHTLVKTGFPKLEQAFKARHVAVGTPAPDTGQPDGGLGTYFGPYLDFVPKAPDGYYWVYGQRLVAPLDYFFCLAPIGSGTAREGDWRGFLRGRQLFPADQYVIHGSGLGGCGTVVNSTSSTPIAAAAITFFVRPTP